jgi:hypothetical protein
MQHFSDDQRTYTEFPGQEFTKYQKRADEGQEEKKRREILRRWGLETQHGAYI